MAHGTEQHLEHAEHAQHQAHDPFDKRVAMTMAVVAAVLATVTLLSHQAHNKTLQYQIESGKKKTEAANRWAQYQSKSIRGNMYQAFLDLLPALVQPDKQEEAKKAASKMQGTLDRYRTPPEKEKNPDDPDGLPGLMEIARGLEKEAERLEKDSHHEHHLGVRFDASHLVLEMALILCTISLLTKLRLFWFSGIAVGLVGAGVGVSAFLIAH